MYDPLDGLFPKIAEALRPSGWSPRPSDLGIEYVKTEPVRGGEFELILRFDRQRPHWPPDGIINIASGKPDDFPWHRWDGDRLCHFDPATAEWDPESVFFDRHVLYLAEHFIAEFHRLQKGEALTAADMEFAVHWSGRQCYLDIPENDWPSGKDARMEAIKIVAAETGLTHTVYRLAGQNGNDRFGIFGEINRVALVPSIFISIPGYPSPSIKQWPPETLADLNSFLHRHSIAEGKLLWKLLAGALARSNSVTGNALVIINTAAGRFGAIVEAHHQQLANYRAKRLPPLLSLQNSLTKRIPIQRITFLRLDEDLVLGRNEPSQRPPLAGLNIHLVGLGAVGSVLAEQLVQAGAGSGGGHMHLFDFDNLRPENLGRHLLGVPYLGMNKAAGVVQYLMRNRLSDNLHAHRAFWGDPGIHDDADLVIDATAIPCIGSALSNAARKLRQYPVVSTFVEGEGWVAGAFIYRGIPGEACRSCTEPWLGGSGVNIQTAHVPPGRENGCGGVYTPFRAAAASVAAALTSELICEWALGTLVKTYRTIRMPGAPTHVRASRLETPRSKSDCECASSPLSN